jgi:hypothetical protein
MSEQASPTTGRKNVGKYYPDSGTDHLDKIPPVRLNDEDETINRGYTRKEQLFWEDQDDHDDEQLILTKKELDEYVTKKMQLFWEDQKKNEQLFWENRKPEQRYWERPKSEQTPLLWEQAQRELKGLLNRTSTSEQATDYEQYRLNQLMRNPKQYSEEQAQAIVDSAFAEICAAFSKNKLMTKDEAAVAASRNTRAKGFFRPAR